MTEKVNWKKHPARAIILSDLENERLPLYENEMSSHDAFYVHYKNNDTVQAVGFKEFEKRLKDHRRQVSNKKDQSRVDWKKNPARAIILSDLESGRLPLDETVMSPDYAFFNFYKDNRIVQAVGIQEFKKRLKDHRKQVLTKKNNESEKLFGWKNSEARCIILEDLYRGILSLEDDATEPRMKWESYYKGLEKGLNEHNEAERYKAFEERLRKTATTAEKIWESHYKYLPAFQEVKLDQFTRNLAGHRKQVKAGKRRSMEEEEMWREDLKNYPPKSTDANGKPLWDCHPAKLLLRKDVAERKNKTMKPKQLQASRDEYKDFPLEKFRPHIYQENRRRRFCNYLNDKRVIEKNIHCCKPPVGDNDTTMADRLDEAIEDTLVDHMNGLQLLGGDEIDNQMVVEDEIEVLEEEEEMAVITRADACKRQINEVHSSNKQPRLN